MKKIEKYRLAMQATIREAEAMNNLLNTLPASRAAHIAKGIPEGKKLFCTVCGEQTANWMQRCDEHNCCMGCGQNNGDLMYMGDPPTAIWCPKCFGDNICKSIAQVNQELLLPDKKQLDNPN